MAVTELALMRILPPTTATSQSLLSHLKAVKEAIEKFSGFEFTFYQCLEDPNIILVFGGWSSVEFHMEQWLPSKENQDFVQLLKDEANIEWMWHVNIEPVDRSSIENAKVIALGRHRIIDGQKETFEKRFGEVRGGLERFAGGSQLVKGGWRLHRGFVNEGVEDEFKEGTSAEWIFLTGWDSKEAHGDFSKSKEFEEFGKLRELMDSSDVKHGVKMVV